MPTTIDHLVLGSSNLDSLSAWWRGAAGEPATAGGAHVGRGTRNELVGLGETSYLELIGPDREQPAPANPRPFGIDRLTSDKPVLLTFAVAVADLEAARDRYRAAGLETTEPFAMERVTPQGEHLAWRLSLPLADQIAGVIPFLIEWGSTTSHPATSLHQSSTLRELRLRYPKPEMVRSLATSLGLDVSVARGDASLEAVIETGNGVVALRS